MILNSKYFVENGEFFNKKVIVRVDYNVPTENGKITDLTRIEKSLKTINYLLSSNAKIILISHKGRPKERNKKDSLEPVKDALEKLLKENNIKYNRVLFVDDCIGDKVKNEINKMENKDILILENLRFYKEEEENDEKFAKELSSLADIYVSDAFGAVHRAHASITGIAKFIPFYYGYLIKEEVDNLNHVLHSKEYPVVALIGGSKVSSKIDVLNSLINKVNILIIGGAMAYTFLKSKGLEVGNSLVENDKLIFVNDIFSIAKQKNVEIVLPVDHIVVENIENYKKVIKTKGPEIPQGMIGVDIGPKTIKEFMKNLKRGKVIFWNGPVGIFENNDFARGTMELAKGIAKIKAIKVVGGGDSVAAINQANVEKYFTHVSTGGGASLEYIEGKKLPGLEIFED
jgi:phosphoglycerate kinase